MLIRSCDVTVVLLTNVLLFTQDDRHLMAAEIPSTSPDVLIVESTYGVQVSVAATATTTAIG
jgi:Cft2 family RNA processing exonuclease